MTDKQIIDTYAARKMTIKGKPVFQIQDALQSGKEDAGHGIKRVYKEIRGRK